MSKLTSYLIPAIVVTAAVFSAVPPAAASGPEFQLAQLPMQMQTDDPHIQKMLDESVADAPMTWTTPDGWQEAKGSGMRMATFTPVTGEAVECSVIALKGMAGGVEGNIQRWMDQIDLSMPPELFAAYMDNLETVAISDGTEAYFVDLTQFQENAGEDTPSMIASILQLPTQTVFFKLTGPLGAVKNNAERLRALLASVTVKQSGW
ncbi:MAG: hypothetical protein KC897_11410 [Candidatus Omnitrophica bacterium]|nr:hypothetical protein [Candidatus Omnitrophota bacterium]MCB9721899.1 hypothetical protein [Candidatus Omnitrophota bacterium]